MRIGLALGAGGAKGLAHIGVLQVLIKESIPIDLIAGSSMGAIVGAAHAAGTDIDLLAKLAVCLNQSLFVDVTIPRMGLLKGDKASEFIKLITHGKDFNELEIPLVVMATDLERGEKVILKEGRVVEAVRASMSIPGIFQPVQHNGRILVDGAVSERIPTSVLKDMGADFIIGVDVKSSSSARIEIKNIYDVIMQSIDILEKESSKNSLLLADVIISPDVGKVGTTDFHLAQECIDMGRSAAEEKLDEIKAKIARLSFQEKQAL